jgi:hypothetical protein
MKPSTDIVLEYVGRSTWTTDSLERYLVCEDHSLEDVRQALDELVSDGTLTRGRSDPNDPTIRVVVTRWSPRMAALIQDVESGSEPKKSYCVGDEGDAMTDCQKQFLMDTETYDEETRCNSDSASLRRYLRGFGEYCRFKADFLAKNPDRA